MSMPHYLKMPKQQQVAALLALGWSYRRIEAETGVRRETVGRYDRMRRSNAAKVFPGSEGVPPGESGEDRAAEASNAANEPPRDSWRLHFLGELGSWQSPHGIHRKSGSERFGWCSSTKASIPRSGRRSARSPGRLGARGRPCGTGSGGPSGMPVGVPG